MVQSDQKHRRFDDAVEASYEIRSWFEGASHLQLLDASARYSLRALPFVFTSDSAFSNSGKALLSALRAALVSNVNAYSGSVLPFFSAEQMALKFARAFYSDARNSAETGAGYAIYASAYAVQVVNEAAAEIRTSEAAGAAIACCSMYAIRAGRAPETVSSEIRRSCSLDRTFDKIGGRPRPLTEVSNVPELNFLRLGQDQHPWTFWAEWYDRAMAGDPLPWDLQEQVALIPDEIWEAGPEAVAEEIKRIQLEYVSTSLPQAGGIRFDDEAAVFRKAVPEVARPQLLGATLAQVEGALEDVLADPTNGLHERSREVQVLSRMLERFGNDPQRIEMDCTSVYGSLTRQLTGEDPELPPSEQNLALREAVNDVAEGIRATDPEIAENRRILSEVKLRNMGEEGLAAFEEALPVLEAVSDEELGAEFRADILELTERMRLPVLGEEPRNPGIRAAYDEEVRVFKRIADMAILAKTGTVIHKIDGSAVYKGARIAVTGAGLLGILGGLVALVAGLF